MELHGKVSLVSGSSRGIGRAIALMLAEAGSDVIVNYASNRGGREVVARSGTGSPRGGVQSRRQQPFGVNDMVSRALDVFGPIRFS